MYIIQCNNRVISCFKTKENAILNILECLTKNFYLIEKIKKLNKNLILPEKDTYKITEIQENLNIIKTEEVFDIKNYLKYSNEVKKVINEMKTKGIVIISDKEKEDLKKKIEKLKLLKQQAAKKSEELRKKKIKKEKSEERKREFEADKKIYNKLKNESKIPELFEFKYKIFKKIEENSIKDDFNYYIKCMANTQSLGTDKYQKIFGDYTPHTHLTDSEDEEVHSDSV